MAKQYAEHKLIMVSAGGDGTFIWLLNELIENQVNLERIHFAVLPHGTGNDLSQILGWGELNNTNLIENYLQGLKKLVRRWIQGVPCKFDIWDVEVDTFENGYFEKIQKGKKITLKRSNKNVNRINSMMGNYMGIGIDGQIGMNFEANRSKYRIINNLCYFLSAVRIICSRSEKMVDTFEEMKQVRSKSNSVEYYQNSLVDEKAVKKEESGQIDIGCDDEKSRQIDIDLKENLLQQDMKRSTSISNILINQKMTPKSNDLCLVALNIPNYMGGRVKPYQSSKNFNKQCQFQPQSINDGKIEFVTFENQLSMGIETVFKGNAFNLFQGEGPFEFNFKRYEKRFRTFFQIDGEFYKVYHPKCILIQRTSKIKDGQITVLTRN